MAESPLQKLQRLAREKKAAEASAAASASKTDLAEQMTPNTEANLELRMRLATEKPKQEEKQDDYNEIANSSVESVSDVTGSDGNVLGSEVPQAAQSNTVMASTIFSDAGNGDLPSSKSSSTHPLAMQFAELEQGILARDPQFKTILRDIHRQLGTEPELVTQMTEAEIALVVQGLVQRAQEEIVTPAATKAAKKKVITVDDL